MTTTPDKRLCGVENPDYPGEYACTFPAGHGPIPWADIATGDDLAMCAPGETWQHAAPASGAAWSVLAPAVRVGSDVPREMQVDYLLDVLDLFADDLEDMRVNGYALGTQMVGRARAVARRARATLSAAEPRHAGGGKRLVILESPYAGDVERNVAYARRALADSLHRDEAPIASRLLYTQPGVLADSLHRDEAPIASRLLYTQPGVLDDTVPAERRLGIDAGLAWGRVADATVMYADLGITPGMQQGIDRAAAEGRIVEVRYLDLTVEGTDEHVA